MTDLLTIRYEFTYSRSPWVTGATIEVAGDRRTDIVSRMNASSRSDILFALTLLPADRCHIRPSVSIPIARLVLGNAKHAEPMLGLAHWCINCISCMGPPMTNAIECKINADG